MLTISELSEVNTEDFTFKSLSELKTCIALHILTLIL